MDPICVCIIESFVRHAIVKPPQFTLAHPNLIRLGPESTAGRALEDEVIAIAKLVVDASVDMGVDTSVWAQLNKGRPAWTAMRLACEALDELARPRQVLRRRAWDAVIAKRVALARFLESFASRMRENENRFRLALNGDRLLSLEVDRPDIRPGIDLADDRGNVDSGLDLSKEPGHDAE